MTTITLGSNIVLECDHSEIIDICVKDNTFANPQFLVNEANGRSNFQTESTIATFRYEGGCLVLPRGYMRSLLWMLRERGVDHQIVDQRISRPCQYPYGLNGIILREYQIKAVCDAMRYDQGLITSPMGSGKSLIGLEIIRQRGEKALIVVHRKELANQWLRVIKERLGLTVGFIGDGEWAVGEEITVALIQTLSAQEERTKELSWGFGLVLVDEGHHCPCDQFFSVLGIMKAKYRYSLSATPNRRDGLEAIIYRATGPEISHILREEVEECGATVPVTVLAINTHVTPRAANTWHEYIDAISEDAQRNILIIELAQQSDGSTLVLVDRIDHATQLSHILTRQGIDHVLAHGKLKKEGREGLMDRIKEAKITIGTTGLLGEGIDVASWSNLIMGSPISSEIKLLQAIGRVVRPGVGKENALIYDLRDDCAFSGASFNKRFKIYKKNSIWVEFNPEQKKALRT